MRPAFSVVAFTVLSGVGLGALALLALHELAVAAGLVDALAGATVLARAGIAAIVVLALGLCSSTLHLANPRNAWRSLSRVRSSWLSREAAVSLVLLPVAAAFVASVGFGAAPALRALLAVATALLAWGTLYCTAMIYASLKPIRQWHTRRVPVGYFALGHASGALLLVGILRAYGEPAAGLAWLAFALIVVAALIKLDYYAYIASDVRAVTIEQAIGVPQGVGPHPVPGRRQSTPSRMAARLLDPGHSKGTFLTHEFGYRLTPGARSALRGVVWAGVFAIPLLWLVFGLPEGRGAVVAGLAMAAGLVAERWLFFAEAIHTVRLYHGDVRT